MIHRTHQCDQYQEVHSGMNCTLCCAPPPVFDNGLFFNNEYIIIKIAMNHDRVRTSGQCEKLKRYVFISSSLCLHVRSDR